jgi:hypothetical protein
MADSTNTIDIAVSNSVDPQIAPRLISIADASDKAGTSVGNLKSQLASLQSSGGSLASQLQNVRGTMSQTATATNGLVSANVSAAASLGILEGRTLSMNRAAANFATRVLGLGGILQAAFPIIGAVAMIDVLYQMGSSLKKAYEQAKNAGREIAKGFEEATTLVRRSNDQLALTNNKLDQTIAKLSHKPTTNGAAMALDEARVMADRLDESLDEVGKRLDSVLSKNAVSVWGGLITQQKSTTEASRQIKERYEVLTQEGELKAEQRLEDAGAKVYASVALKQKAINDALAEGMKDRSNAVKTFRDEMQRGQNQDSVLHMNQAGDKTKTPGTGLKAEWEEYGGAVKLANEELRSFDLTMGNMTKNATVDKLHDQTSSLLIETKEAAKQWKELEAAFVQFQSTMDKEGHKPTAEQNLAFLVGKEPTINPLNRDKLTAKELPFQNQIAGQSFDKNETAKLKDQVSVIGLYDDAMKEAIELDHIKEAAQRSHITLSAEQVEKYKGLIATIVENRDYDKELETVYKSLNSVADEYKARIQAITTLHDRGQMTQEQYNKGLAETTKHYNEASDAVTRFKRELADQQRDASNKLGTQAQIAVKGILQGKDKELREKGDAAHPFGYSEAEIAKANAALSPLIEAQQRKNAVDQEANKLINAQANLDDQLRIKEDALTQAVNKGAMSQQAANSERLKDKLAQNDQQLSNGTGGNPYKGAIMDYAKDFTTLGKGIESTMKPVFKTLADGFADSIGKAVVYSKNLGSALKDVARSALSELISGMAKLAIETVIVNTIMKKLHIKPLQIPTGPTAKQASEGVAGMAAITVAGVIMTKMLTKPMWSLAEAMAGVTFGLSAAAGAAGITALATAGTAAQSGGGAGGGVQASLATGTNFLTSDMIIQAHQGERIIPAADNRAMIAALENSSGNSSNGKTRIEIHNNGNGHVETQEVSDDHIRLIIHAETPNLISKHAPGIIAGDIGNPNSKTSKALARSTYSTRRR